MVRIRGLTNGVLYEVRVKSRNDRGDSVYSPIVTATPAELVGILADGEVISRTAQSIVRGTRLGLIDFSREDETSSRLEQAEFRKLYTLRFIIEYSEAVLVRKRLLQSRGVLLNWQLTSEIEDVTGFVTRASYNMRHEFVELSMTVQGIE